MNITQTTQRPSVQKGYDFWAKHECDGPHKSAFSGAFYEQTDRLTV